MWRANRKIRNLLGVLPFMFSMIYAGESKVLSLMPLEVSRDRLPEISPDVESFLYNRFISDISRIEQLRIIEYAKMRTILAELEKQQQGQGEAANIEFMTADWKGFLTIANFRQFTGQTDLYKDYHPSSEVAEAAKLQTKITVDLYFRAVDLKSNQVIVAEKATGSSTTGNGYIAGERNSGYRKLIHSTARESMLKSAMVEASDALSRRIADQLAVRYGFQRNRDLAPPKGKSYALGLSLAIIPGLGLVYAEKPAAASTTIMVTGFGIGGIYLMQIANPFAFAGGLLLAVVGGSAYAYSFVNTYTSIAALNEEKGFGLNQRNDLLQHTVFAVAFRF